MREIKFKGITAERCNGKYTRTGEVVYGDYVDDHTTIYLKNHFTGKAWEVDPASVVQLIGRDKNGAEVYENDWVKSPFKPEPFKADMRDIYSVGLYELVEVTK